jgi:hypothetical protein
MDCIKKEEQISTLKSQVKGDKEDFSEYYKKVMDDLDVDIITEQTTEKIREFVRETIHLEITNNIKKIYEHLKEPYENFIKSLTIDLNDYSIHVVFTRHPTNDEMARVYSAFVATPFNFNTCFKVIEQEGEGLKITNLKISLSE